MNQSARHTNYMKTTRNNIKLNLEGIKAFVAANPETRIILQDGYAAYSPVTGRSAGINGNAFNAFKAQNDMRIVTFAAGKTAWMVA